MRKLGASIAVVPLGVVVAMLMAFAPALAAGTPDVAGRSVIVEGHGAYMEVSVAGLARMLEGKDFTLINVHVPYAGEIEGTDLFIPFDRIAAEADRLPGNRGARLVVYCRSGAMSAVAARALVALGYTDVWNVDGGMRAWAEAGYPLVGTDRAGAGQPLAYAALAHAKKVVVIGLDEGRVVRTMSVPMSPHGIAASADGRRIFVPDLLQDRQLRVIDAASGEELARTPLEGPVHHLARSGRYLYATLTSTGRLAIIDTVDGSARTVEVGGAPDSALAAPDLGLVYVSDIGGDTVAAVDPATGRVRQWIAVTGGPGHGALSASGTTAYFTLASAGSIAAIDLREGRQVATLSVGTDPHGVAVGHAGRRLFVSDRARNAVVVIDLATFTIEREIEVGDGPEHVAPSPDGRQILVGLPPDRVVVVIDAERLEITRRIAVDGDPHQIAF